MCCFFVFCCELVLPKNTATVVYIQPTNNHLDTVNTEKEKKLNSWIESQLKLIIYHNVTDNMIVCNWSVLQLLIVFRVSNGDREWCNKWTEIWNASTLVLKM